jgi:hypothetical protein
VYDDPLMQPLPDSIVALPDSRSRDGHNDDVALLLNEPPVCDRVSLTPFPRQDSRPLHADVCDRLMEEVAGFTELDSRLPEGIPLGD